MLQIRTATSEDCSGIARVQVDSYRNAYAGLFPKSYLEHFTYEEEEQDWRELLLSSTDDMLLVAVSADQQIVGYALGRPQPDSHPDYDSEIVALHVRQTYQQQSIGNALLKKAVEELIKRGYKSVMLWTLKNNPIRRWYERLEGKVIGEKTYQVDDWEIVEVAYGWKNMALLLVQ